MSMHWVRGPYGAALLRKYVIGTTVSPGQIVCWAGLKGNGVIGDPASVNDYTEALGVTTEGKTYSNVQGSGGNVCEIAWDPWGIYRGKCSGGVAADTAFAAALNGNLLVNTAASAGGTTVTDGNVGTSEFTGGYLIGLSGVNQGHVRVIDAHTDNTSTAVDDPFDSAIAAGDAFIRAFGPAMQGLELTTDFCQFNMVPGAGVDLPDSGNAIVFDVLMDGQPTSQSLYVNIRNASAPVVEVEFFFSDHAFNSLA